MGGVKSIEKRIRAAGSEAAVGLLTIDLLNNQGARDQITPAQAGELLRLGITYGVANAQMLAVYLGAQFDEKALISAGDFFAVYGWLVRAGADAVAPVADALVECQSRVVLRYAVLHPVIRGQRHDAEVAGVLYDRLIARSQWVHLSVEHLLAAALLSRHIGRTALGWNVMSVPTPPKELVQVATCLFLAAHGEPTGHDVAKHIPSVVSYCEREAQVHVVWSFAHQTLRELARGAPPPAAICASIDALPGPAEAPAEATPSLPELAQVAPGGPAEVEPPRVAECPVCLAALPRVAYGCGHATCEACDAPLRAAAAPCPVCRAAVEARVRIYL